MMRKSFVISATALILLALLAPVAVSLDNPFFVYGDVYNSTGALVPAGVNVTVRDVTVNGEVYVLTDAAGHYQIDVSPIPNSADGDEFMCSASNASESGSCSFTLDLLTPSQQCDITLTPLTIVVTPPSPVTIIVGETQQFTATVKDPTGNPMQDINITWTSSNTTVGTVSPIYDVTGADGKAYTTFTASAVGTTTIKAENGTVSGTAGVTVSSDMTSPVITDVEATDKTNSSATITWTTDDYSTSVVKYGNVSGIYPYTNSTSGYVKSHSVALTGLSEGMTYYYVVNSTNSDGFSNESSEYSFRTSDDVVNGNVTFMDPVVNETLTSITFDDHTLNGTINVSSHTENPSGVGIPTTIKTPVGYLSIEVPAGWGPATIHFRVKLTALPTGMDKTDVKLYQLVGTSWTALPPTPNYVGVVGGYATYTATVTSWSYFAISAAVPPTPPRRPGGGGAPRDSDGDGYSDIDEMLAGTDPNDPSDYPGAPLVTPTPILTPTPTPAVTPTATPTVPPPVTPTPPVTPPVKPPVKWGLIIGIIIAVVAIVVAAYYFYTKKKA